MNSDDVKRLISKYKAKLFNVEDELLGLQGTMPSHSQIDRLKKLKMTYKEVIDDLKELEQSLKVIENAKG